jgi:DNA-binding LacI/PurR family transcriptional regulator
MGIDAVTLRDGGGRARKGVDLDKLAHRVMSVCAQAEADGAGMCPSEREIAAKLEVSRHAVRAAIDYLEQLGTIRRLAGRGMISLNRTAAPAEAGPGLKCINFLHGPAHQQSSLQWLTQEYLAGYTEVLDHYSIKTRFVYWEDGRRDFETMFWSQAARGEQGCVLMNRREPELLAWLNEAKVPYVVQNHAAYDDAHLPVHKRICVNKMGGAFEATRKLIEMGHRRIGFAGHLPAVMSMTPEYEGWAAAMRCAGLTPRVEDTVDLPTEELAPALGPCMAFLKKSSRPTAIVASHGAATLGVAVAAEKLGMKVPQELSVIGFTSNLTHQRSDLSLIEVPRHELSRGAVELVLKLARPETAASVESRVLNCVLTLRKSTGAPGVGVLFNKA